MDEWHALDSTELPEDLAAVVKPELMPRERLIWAARPDPVRDKVWLELLGTILCCFGAMAISVLCFAVFAGAIGGKFGAKLQESDTTFAVLGVFFVILGLMGFYAVTVQGVKNLMRGVCTFRAVYALTDRRAIIWWPTHSTDGIGVFTISRSLVKSVHRVDYPAGGGAVIFRFVDVLPYDAPHSFDRVRDVRRVEEYVRQVFLLDPAP